MTHRKCFGLAAEPNVSEANLKYFYGEVEDHCHCEKHRSCKRGGEIGKNDSPSLPKITYDDDFENRMARINPRALRSSVYDLSGEGLPELSADMQIGFINGIDNTFEEAKESARYLSKLAGGYNIHAVYNATHGKYYDLQECLMGLDYIATEPVRQLHRMWNSFFEKSAHGKFLMICHSQGAIHVRNALLDYPQELRERIHVVAIAPGGYIYKLTCAQLIHYRTEACRDFIPRIDRTGALREQELIIDLQSHPDANFFDHSINSPTYSDEIINRIQNYIKSNRAM